MGIKRSEVVAAANSWIGKKESDGSHKSIIDIYNTQTSLPRNYKMTYTAAWCAATYTAIFQYLNALSMIAPECSCGYMIADAKTKGIWQESDSYVPKLGDGVMYDWDDDGVGDNTGWPEHVGIVVETNGSTFKVVEGNKSDAVGTRTMSVNGKYIRGFIVPNFDEETTTSTTTTSSDLTVDGEWGSYTTKRTQEVLGTTQDGIVSNQLNSCKDYLLNANSGSWDFDEKGTGGSLMIKALQKLISATVDGYAGQNTVKALQTYLNSKNSAGLTVDGYMGELTVKAWQTWLNKQ